MCKFYKFYICAVVGVIIEFSFYIYEVKTHDAPFAVLLSIACHFTALIVNRLIGFFYHCIYVCVRFLLVTCEPL